MTSASLLLVLNVLASVLGKGDLRHFSANKAFIDRLDPAKFEIVHPFQIRERNERIGIDTRNYFLNGTKHYEHATIVIRSAVLGRVKLILELNSVLLPNATQFIVYDSVGTRPPAYRLENCYYQGTVNGDLSTFVSISSCNGLRGVIGFENGSAYGIWPLEGGDRGRRHPHVLYQSTWRRDSYSGNNNNNQLRLVRRLAKRDVTRQTKYIELALLGDNFFLKEQNMSEESAITYALEAVNTGDLMLSRYLNVRLSVVSFEAWLDVQRVDMHPDTQRSLGGLVDYVTGHMFEQVKDATVLITGAGKFTGNEQQMAGYASICTARASALVTAVDRFSVQETGQSMAQAIGMMLGIDHDSGPCACEMGSHCVMDRRMGWVDAPFTWQFSHCSIARMHSVLQSGHLQCLLNKPLQASALHQCGNGVVDGEEQCDCGSRASCSDSCCDPLTCRLKAHAECAAHNTCCDNCKLRRQGTVCRLAQSMCDVEEQCNGLDGDCPLDAHLIDGSQCGDSETGQCWKGRCADKRAQCRRLWGKDADIGDQRCFERFNVLGVEHGNCGSGRDGKLTQCTEENVACGTLHCKFGHIGTLDTTLDSFNSQFFNDGEHIQCKIVINSKLGMVEDGSSCGSASVCVQGACVPLTQASSPVHCPSNNLALQCSGHGHCTTARQCVCFDGWMGVACDVRTNLTKKSITTTTTSAGLIFPSFAVARHLETPALLGILLIVGIVLLLFLVCLLFCYRRRTTAEFGMSGDKMSDISIENNQRIIKFGNMPSYREEKRKKKRNKRVYDALNRINEASDERDSVSVKSQNSSSRLAANDQSPQPQTMMNSSELMRANGILKKEIAARIYEDGIIYGNTTAMSSSPGTTRGRLLNGSDLMLRNGRDHSSRGSHCGYSTDGELTARYIVRGQSPCGSVASASSRMQATPLKLNNIELLLRQLNDGVCEDTAELSGVEADRGDLGSNTESSREAPRLSPDHYELAQLNNDFEQFNARRTGGGPTKQSPTSFQRTENPYHLHSNGLQR